MKLLRALTMVAFQSCARIFRIQLLYIFYMCSVIDDAWGIGIISYHSICLGHFNTDHSDFHLTVGQLNSCASSTSIV